MSSRRVTARPLVGALCVAAAAFLGGALRAEGPVPAQPAQPDPATSTGPATQHRDALRLVDLWLDAQVAYDRVPALSAGVVVGSSLVWSKGYGAIDAQRRVPATAQTVYSICSISKLFTAIAVMQLWEAGRVALDDDIGRYLSGFALQRTDPDGGPITLRALLTHSSGLPREGGFGYWSPPDFTFPSREALMQGLQRQRTFQRPGDHFQYSNLGMAVLGEVVAAVSGMPYEAYVQSRILTPLGLVDTRPFLPLDLSGQRLAVGYGALKRDGSRDLLKAFDTRGLAAAAGYTATVDDLARFAAWQFRLHRTGGSEVLRVATLRDMQRVQWVDPDGDEPWGLGFAVTREGGNTVVSHSGHCPGYRTALALALKDEVAVVALANANSAGPYTKGMRQVMLKGLRLPVPAPPPGGTDLEAYAGRYAVQPWGSEQVIVPWGADLAGLELPSADPAGDLEVLRRTGPDTFRRVRADGSLADELVFERDAAARVTGYRAWAHFYPRLAAPW